MDIEHVEELNLQKQKKRYWIRKLGRGILTAAIFLAVVLLVMILLFAIYVNKKIEKSVDEELFALLGSDSKTRIYRYQENSKTGELQAVELEGEDLYGGYRCIYADYDQMPNDLIDAFVSIEDKRFFDHKGVDWKRTVSAGANYFLKFSNSFGGSTITQQLIKNVTDKADYSFQRKLQEIFWALDLETKMDKKEILELYLNIINLSQGCYGVQAASNYYFSKDVSQLTLNECACIAAITNSPSYYDPIRNPEHNLQRKDLILKEMYNQGYISENELNENLNKEAVLSVADSESSSVIHSWYVDMVIEDVINDLITQKGYSRAVANLMIYTGGMKIYTAIDQEIQTILEEYYEKTAHFYSGSGQTHPQSSMIIIDPENGDILGVVGAVGTKNANRVQNFATQTLRPAGSVVKPLSVYAPAFEHGLITWGTVYDDVPVNFGENDSTPWPQNASGEFRGLTDVNTAIENSINTVTVRILQDLGVESAFDFLYDELQMKSLIRSGYTADGQYITDMDLAALALGQMNYGVTVEEITAAYSIFVNQGIYNTSRSYYKVTDGMGSIILENRYHGEAVISKENAAILSLMLENVVKNGTAKSISLSQSIACAGKTGTTQNNYDRWYIGYTPYVIGGVWYGYEYPKALSGKNQCIRIWDEVMTQIHTKKGWTKENTKSFDLSEAVIEAEYCADSGQKISEACKRDPRGDRIRTGYFVKGSEPAEYCSCHIPVAYDVISGGVVYGHDCPKENIKYVGLITVDRSFPIQIYVSDAQYVWRSLSPNILPETATSLPFFYRALSAGEYCGISNTTIQYNRLCRAHFDYDEWKKKHEKAQ